ncbi:ATP-dependent DNA ligase [Streptomyces umbrinus]|uniref:ATP-dependent DNA ligase n=1 Tax=Streptomyces umbrinus TaxID=67370 RepID=UPI0033D5DAA9
MRPIPPTAQAVCTGHPGGARRGWKTSTVMWTLPEPMLAAPVTGPDLPPGGAAEPKWDGFRALVSVDAGRVLLRSRRGTEMGPAFPEIMAGVGQLPDATALDGVM